MIKKLQNFGLGDFIQFLLQWYHIGSDIFIFNIILLKIGICLKVNARDISKLMPQIYFHIDIPTGNAFLTAMNKTLMLHL